MSTENDKPDKPRFHIEDGVAVFDTELDHIRHEQAEAQKRDKEYKTEQLKIDRRMVLFTALLVICTLGTNAISLYQASIAKTSAAAARSAAETAAKTLTEVQKGETDTHELAEAAKQQAGNTDRLARAAGDQVSKLQASVTEIHSLAGASQDAVALTRKGQTAWIGVVEPLLHSITYEGGNIVMHGTLGLKNFGSSPATKVAAWVVSSTNWENMEAAEQSACASAKAYFELSDKAVKESLKDHDLGNTIFPSQELRLEFQSAALNPKNRSGLLYSVGCMYYRDNLKQARKTEFCLLSSDVSPSGSMPIRRCPWYEQAE